MVENRNENTENGRALIVGLGKSGIAVAEALKRWLRLSQMSYSSFTSS